MVQIVAVTSIVGHFSCSDFNWDIAYEAITAK